MNNTNPCNDNTEPTSEAKIARLLRGMNNPAIADNIEQMEALATDVISAVAKYEDSYPSPDAELESELDTSGESGAWPAVIKLRDHLIDRCASRGEFHQVFRHQREASWIAGLLGDLAQARHRARCATDAARKVEGMPVLIGFALVTESNWAFAAGDSDSALAWVNEAIDLIGSQPYARIPRAGALIMRARCHLEMGDFPSADSDLAQARKCLTVGKDSSLLAGARSKHAGILAAHARLCLARGEVSSAVKAAKESLKHAAAAAAGPLTSSFTGGVALALAHHGLAQIFAGAGQPYDAQTANGNRNRILSELKLPALPSYL
jgi:hypothetical protein